MTKRSISSMTMALALSLGLVTGMAQAAETLALVDEGVEKAVIVTADKPSPTAEYAAKELQTALKKTLKLDAAVVKESAAHAEARVVFYVGDCVGNKNVVNLDELPFDHFVLKVVGNNIHLVGKDDSNNPLEARFEAKTGTLYAVYRFMHDELGVRRIFPGELGEIYPVNDSVKLSDKEIKDGPSFPIRTFAYGHYGRFTQTQRDDFIRFGRFNGMGGSITGSFGHSGHHLFGWGGEKLYQGKGYATNPEWFAMRNGKRGQPTRNTFKFCYSNEELAKLYADWGVNAEAWPDYFSVSANDAGGWCQCAECEKLDAGQKSDDMAFGSSASHSGQMFTFANRVALEVKRRGSKKRVGIFAYASYVSPPKTISKMEDNVLVQVAQGIYWTASPVHKDNFSDLMTGWSKKATSLSLRDYFDNGGPLCFIPYPRLANQTIKKLDKLFPSFMGINGCGDTSQDFALSGPNLYLYAHLLWNKNANLEDILDDYYTSGWPAAHETIRQYFELFETRFYSYMKDQKGIPFFPWNLGANVQYAQELYTPEIMTQAAALLEKANKEAKSDAERQRVDYLKIGYDAVANDLAYYRAVMLGASGQITLIPFLKESAKLTTGQKIEYLKQAKELDAKRIAFWKQHIDCTAIPAPALMADMMAGKRFSLQDEIDEVLRKYESGESVDGNLMDATWKFKQASMEEGLKEKFETPGYDDQGWKDINGEVLYTSQGYSGYTGWAWYRKQLTFPKISDDKRLILTLGAVDESYELYVNGQHVQSFKYDGQKNPDSWKQPQSIDISDCVVQDKPNTLALVVHNQSGAGGLWKQSFWALSIPRPEGPNRVERAVVYTCAKELPDGVIDVKTDAMLPQCGVLYKVVLEQSKATPIYVSAESRAIQASGAADGSYAVYLDVKHTDGTYTYAITQPFTSSPHDWESRQIVFKPEKQIESVNMYLHFRKRVGHVQFRNPQLIEMSEGTRQK